MHFQITMSLALIVSGVSMFMFVGFLLFPIMLITHLVLTIIGTLEANKGRMYRYPMTLRLIKQADYLRRWDGLGWRPEVGRRRSWGIQDECGNGN